MIPERYRKLIDSLKDEQARDAISSLVKDISSVLPEFYDTLDTGKPKTVGNPSTVPLITWNPKTGKILGMKPAAISIPSTAVADTNTIDLDSSTGTLTANVIYQDTNTVDIADDAGGLKANVRYQSTATVTLSEDAAGLKADVIMGGVDHGSLAGLLDDDHSQYLFLAGRAGGQIAVGGTAASENLILRATSNATDGNIIFQTDPTTERMRINTTGQLLVGTATALASSSILELVKHQNDFTMIRIFNNVAGTAAQTGFRIINNTLQNCSLLLFNSLYFSSGINVADTAVFISNVTGGFNFGAATGQASIWTNNIQRLKILGAAGAGSLAGNIGIGVVNPTATFQLKVGTATAGSAPIKLTQTAAVLLTTAEAGAIEVDDGDNIYYTIKTGAARKGFILDDGANLTATRVPFATTNGRLTDSANMVFTIDTLTVPKFISTNIIRLKGYTVAALPVGVQGDTAFVTDAVAPAFLTAAVGGGAIVTPVFFDGGSWVAY